MKVSMAVSVTLLCESYVDLYRWCRGYGDPAPVVIAEKVGGAGAETEADKAYAYRVFFTCESHRETWLLKHGLMTAPRKDPHNDPRCGRRFWISSVEDPLWLDYCLRRHNSDIVFLLSDLFPEEVTEPVQENV